MYQIYISWFWNGLICLRIGVTGEFCQEGNKPSKNCFAKNKRALRKVVFSLDLGTAVIVILWRGLHVENRVLAKQ